MNLKAESVHFDSADKVTRKPVRSLRMMKLTNLGNLNPAKIVNRLRLRYKNDPKFKGKVNSGIRGAATLIAVLIADYFLSKWAAQAENARIKEAIQRLAPQIEVEILASIEAQADVLDALYERDPKAKVFLNINYKLRWLTDHTAGRGVVDGADIEGFSGVELERAELGLAPGGEGLESLPSSYCFGSTTKYKRLSMSEEITVGDLYDDDQPAKAVVGTP